jgi:hypothetical protein
MSEATSAADVLERGLLIGGRASPRSGKLTDDASPWDGEIYARVGAGTPEDITRAADAASFVHGAVLSVDGGRAAV